MAEPRTAISMLINDLQELESEAILTLDDLHWISDPAIHDVVAFLVSHAPANIYAKLGAQRRAEAISLPRASGLLAQRSEALAKMASSRQFASDL